ncbi:MAG: Mur ligase family protein, partial [Candidatus Paceibacterota bacterium]
LGIGGIGISAIARMFLARGVKVSGSDIGESEITKELVRLGAKIIFGQDLNLIPKDSDLIIYTKALEVSAPDFLKQVKSLNIPVLSYPETLSLISKGKFTIAIAGTHGKTTTTAMIGKIMMDGKCDPTLIVGSLIQGPTLDREEGRTFATNFVSGKSDYFVIEADEYRRAFLNLYPKILVITNIDADHLDYYKDLEDVQNAFVELVAKVPKDGILICNPNLPNLAPV